MEEKDPQDQEDLGEQKVYAYTCKLILATIALTEHVQCCLKQAILRHTSVLLSFFLFL